MKLYFTLLCLLSSYPVVHGQAADSVEVSNYLESAIEQAESVSGFDLTDAFDYLERYVKRPLNINDATESQFSQFHFLTALQVASILKYRDLTGRFMDVLELQSVPDIDMATAKMLSRYVTTGSADKAWNGTVSELFNQGSHSLVLRWQRDIEQKKGYLADEKSGAASYAGRPNGYFFRYRYTGSKYLSLGLTGEHDPGEPFFTKNNKAGFDFYSGFIELRDIHPFVKNIIIGDFYIRMGQGLIHTGGFSPGKSALVMNIKKWGPGLKPYGSVNESDFFRGLAATFIPSGDIRLAGFISYRKVDGNVLLPPDNDSVDREQSYFSSLQTSGLHRTEAEISDKNAVSQLTYGGTLSFGKKALHLQVNALGYRFDKYLNPEWQLYNQYYFRGNHQENASVEYSYYYRNFYLFGEGGWSSNHTFAFINGLMVSVDKRIDLSFLYRYFPKDFRTIQSNPFAVQSKAVNENGLYAGITCKLHSSVQLSGYIDLWRHPWLKFGVDAPSSGSDYFVRLDYTIKRKLNAYLQFRYLRRGEDIQYNPYLSEARPSNKIQVKIQLNYKVHRDLECRTRLERVYVKGTASTVSNGMLLFQDFIYKPWESPLMFALRFCVFDTDDYDTRLYAFENDVLNSYSIPQFSGRGTRSYIAVRYKINKHITLETKYGITRYDGITSIGTGNETINGNTASEIKLQTKINW